MVLRARNDLLLFFLDNNAFFFWCFLGDKTIASSGKDDGARLGVDCSRQPPALPSTATKHSNHGASRATLLPDDRTRKTGLAAITAGNLAHGHAPVASVT